MRRQSLSYGSIILGIVFFFAAGPAATMAAGLNQAIPFNQFLAAWLDVLFYCLTVIFLGLGLSNLFN